MSKDKEYKDQEMNNEEMADKSVENQEEKSANQKAKSSKKKSRDKKRNKEEELKEKIQELEDKNEKLHEDYLRLFSEFDNFRKRKNAEINKLYETAGEKMVLQMLPIIDDFERALQHIDDSDDAKAHREGMELIYNKFLKVLKQNGVKEIDAKGKDFDTDYHEAITRFPAPTEDMKGKVVDVTEKGYTMGDKVIRYAKVVVGE